MTPKQLHAQLLYRLRTNKGEYISEAARGMGFSMKSLYNLFTPQQIAEVQQQGEINRNQRTGRKVAYNTMKRIRELHAANAAEHIESLTEREQAVIKFIANRHGCLPTDIVLPCRNREVIEPRQQVIYIFRKVFNYGLSNIGQLTYIGGMDHTTVMHSIKRAEELCQYDDDYNATLTTAIRYARTLTPIPTGWPTITALHGLQSLHQTLTIQ